MNIDLDIYFKKIKLDITPKVDVETLYSIHRQQGFNIPFDMLDYHLGIEPNLDSNYIFKKLVIGNRGGGCSQVNELLGLILERIGFNVSRLLSRVLFNKEDKANAPLGHKILLVELPDKQTFLCDLGFSMYGQIEPIALIINQVYKQYDNYYRLITDDDLGYILQKKFTDNWMDLFSFNLNTYLPQDYIAINYYNSKTPQSIFVQNMIVNMPTTNGRRSLINNEYKENICEQKITTIIKSNDQYVEVLHQKFNIIIPDFEKSLITTIMGTRAYRAKCNLTLDY